MNESRWVEQPSFRMLPAHQCFRACHATVCEINLWLEVQHELFVTQCGAQLRAQTHQFLLV
ncbi:hypothetical protein WQE_51412 [Paraburkholderia hospita]|uniref:Uncharacterized protein n=1 Tax=Paraburkholderia hospita TaxID=169430 RepID=A0ABP2P685_9BURK|nr:hypothetical protein WQE_51412 [Paraburkholderia hospita]